jgi:hypothetical protein
MIYTQCRVAKFPGTFNKFPGFPEIPVGGFPEQEGNPEIFNQDCWETR